MTGMGRETGLAKDQGQARPGMPGTLNPGGFGAMTAILDVPAQRRRKPRGHNGLTGDCRHRDPQDGKSSRNAFESHMAALSRAGQVGYCRTPTSLRPPLIATSGAMDASDLESSRLRYDDSASGRCLVAYAKSEPCCALAGLSPARPGG